MKESLDDGEIELSENALLSNNPDSSNSLQSSTSVNAIFDEFLRNTRTCTHTHTCNPPGPDASHTHTCYHTHTQVIASKEDDNHSKDREHSSLKPRRPSGNREAVRKYREKKKAHTAFLEEEVKKLRLLNQQLAGKLQGQAFLEAEVLRLRSILVDLKGKIDNELGVYPFQKHGSSATGRTSDLPCPTPCFHPHVGSTSHDAICGNGDVVVSWEENCQPAIIDCRAHENNTTNGEVKTVDSVDKMMPSTSQTSN